MSETSHMHPSTLATETRLRALVVEDEPRLAEVLTRMLTLEGWQAQACLDGLSAIRRATEFQPHAVILDVGLPDIDGFEVLRRLRAQDPNVCVLFLTAQDAVEDRVAGIRAGADDYVTKPFSMEEVMARLRGLLRRSGITADMASEGLTVGELVMDEDARSVHRYRIRTAAVLDAQPPQGPVQSPDIESRMGLRFRRRWPRSRALYQLSSQENRRRTYADDSYGPRRRLCA